MPEKSIDRYLPGLFVGLAALLGGLYGFMMPPLQIADEVMHFARAYSVSQGVCVASPDIDMPKSFVDLNVRFPDRLEKHGKISIDDLRQARTVPLKDHELAGNGTERSLAGFINQNVYHCVVYLPQAVVLFAGRHAGWSPLALMYSARMANLAAYILLTFFALRLLPDFRMLLFLIALMPMTLHQAASVSADSLYIAVSFLFAAYVLRLAFTSERLGIRQCAVLALFILFLVLTKSMIASVFLLPLIPGAKFGTERKRWLTIAACLVLAIAGSIIWRQVNQPNMQRMAEQRATHQGVDMPGNLRFVREHPVDLALIFAYSVTDRYYIRDNAVGFVGILGWLAITLPNWLVGSYGLFLLAAAVTQTRAIQFSWLTRGLMLVFALAAMVNILGVSFVVDFPQLYLSGPAMWEEAHVPLQGRYWIPFAFPMLLLLSTGRTRVNPVLFAVFAVGMVLVGNGVALRLVRDVYYL